MKKKVVCALLAALLLLSVCGTAFAGEVGGSGSFCTTILRTMSRGGL